MRQRLTRKGGFFTTPQLQIAPDIIQLGLQQANPNQFPASDMTRTNYKNG